MDSAATGRDLEQRVATYFGQHGYETRCNAVLEGRSGGRHEIDVLAEKSDPLTTFRLAVECKAWQQPIEKDVVSKLSYILGDLGLNKGIIVSLGGARSGAERTAADLGIDIWGPDEIRRHLGPEAARALHVQKFATSTLIGWGHRFLAAPEAAERAIRASGKGRLGVRTLDSLVWFAPIWLPVYAVRFTVARPETRRLKTRLRSETVDRLYESLSGTYVGRVARPWEQVQLDSLSSLRPVIRESKPGADLMKAFQAFQRVSSPAAVQRHTLHLQSLGIPTPCTALSVDQTALVHLPCYAGILESRGGQRVVVCHGTSGEISEHLSHVLTTNLSNIRSQLGG